MAPKAVDPNFRILVMNILHTAGKPMSTDEIGDILEANHGRPKSEDLFEELLTLLHFDLQPSGRVRFVIQGSDVLYEKTGRQRRKI